MDDLDSRPLAHVLGVMVDCADPEGLAAFWAETLGVTVDERHGDPVQFIYLSRLQPAGIRLFFQRVPEPEDPRRGDRCPRRS